MSESRTVCGVEFKLEYSILKGWSAKTENFDESLDADIYVELFQGSGDWKARLWHESLRGYLEAFAVSPEQALRSVVQQLHTRLSDKLRQAQKDVDEASVLMRLVAEGEKR